MKGLKELSRVPYGVKPASGSYQRFIENALKGIPFTGVKIDDLIVSGENAKDHLCIHSNRPAFDGTIPLSGDLPRCLAFSKFVPLAPIQPENVKKLSASIQVEYLIAEKAFTYSCISFAYICYKMLNYISIVETCSLDYITVHQHN